MKQPSIKIQYTTRENKASLISNLICPNQNATQDVTIISFFNIFSVVGKTEDTFFFLG